MILMIISNKQNQKLDAYQPIEQTAFRKGYGKNRPPSNLEHSVEKGHEYNLLLIFAFMDYEKEVDTTEMAALLPALENAHFGTRFTNN